MRIKGRLKAVSKDWESGRWNIAFEVIEGNINEVDKIKDKDLEVEAKRFYNKRTGKANRLMWACINQIAQAERPPRDKWDVYLDYIKRQGQCTLLQIDPAAFPKLQQTWRECEIVGRPIIDGHEKIDVLCYFGSSTYNSREFSILLDEIIEDMKAADLPIPTSEEMKRALEELEAGEKNGQAT